MNTSTAANLPLQSGAGDDHPDTSGDNTVIQIGGAVQPGVIGVAGDIDRFRVELSAGASYRFDLDSGSKGLGYPQLVLRGSSGAALASDVGGGKDGGTQISYTATSSGTYYLDATGTNGNTGSYTVLAAQTFVAPQPDPVSNDDYPARTDTTGVVAPNGAAVQGVLERIGDVDYFRVALEANATYTFALQGSGALQDTVLRLHAEDGRVLSSDDDGAGTKNGGSTISFTAPASGMYYLDVSSDVSQSGAYTLQAVQTSTPVAPQHDDFPASTATAGLLTVNGTSTHGVLESAGDADWLRVDLRSGVLYQLDIEGAPSNTGGTALASPGFSVKTADGNTLNTGGKGGVARLSFVAPADGSYYINVEARDRTSTGTYAVKATTLPDDHPSSPATTGVAQVNGSLTTGRIDAPTDVDHFKVQLVEGMAYTFVLSGTGGPGSLVDTLLRVRNADGKELAANDDSGSKNSSSRLTFTAPSTGTYYLEAAGDGKLVGDYHLSALSAPALIGATPANGAANVARSANVVLTFDRPVQANKGQVSISTPDGAVAALISLDDTSQVTIDGRVITINPAHDLAAGKRYVVNIADGALKDASGNPLAGLGDALSFTTLAGNRAPTADPMHTFPAVAGSVVTGRLPTAVDADGDSITYHLDTPPKQGTLVIERDGRFTYELGLWFTGIDEFRFSVRDSQGGSSHYGASVTMAALPVVQGTAQADALAAAPGANRYVGLEGNDRITTGPDSDVVDAGAGIDAVVVSAARGDATLQRRADGGWTLGSQASGSDHLFEVERLQFTDRSTALDLAGAGGQTARVIGAVFGTAQLKDAALVGRYLALADSGVGGEQVVHQVLADPLFASLAGSLSNADVVRHVYTNIVGHAPTAGETDLYTSLITSGQYSQDSLLWWAASLELTAQRIDLAGLASSGLDFLPVGG